NHEKTAFSGCSRGYRAAGRHPRLLDLEGKALVCSIVLREREEIFRREEIPRGNHPAFKCSAERPAQPGCAIPSGDELRGPAGFVAGGGPIEVSAGGVPG